MLSAAALSCRSVVGTLYGIAWQCCTADCSSASQLRGTAPHSTHTDVHFDKLCRVQVAGAVVEPDKRLWWPEEAPPADSYRHLAEHC